MSCGDSVAETVNYGRKLVGAGISGIRNGRSSVFEGRSVGNLLAESSRDSLKLAAAGACLGLLSYLKKRRGRLPSTLAYGALGSAVGFFVGLGWNTRKVTSGLGHSAVREMRRASDEHWLERNPVDYA